MHKRQAAPTRLAAPPIEPADGDTTLPCILARVRALAERRALWLRALADRDDVNGDHEDLPQPLRTALFDTDAPEAEATFLAQSAAAKALTARAEILRERLLASPDSPLAQAASAFGLDDAESDLVQLCAAAAVDPGMPELFAYLHQGRSRRYPTDSLATRLFGHGRRQLWWAASPLARWQLLSAEEVEPGEPEALRIDPFLLAFLQGSGELDPELRQVASLVPLRQPLDEWPVQPTAERIRRGLDAGEATRVTVVGPKLSGRRSFAALVAHRVGAPLIAIDTGRAGARTGGEAWQRLRLRADRQALLFQCAIAWDGLLDDKPLAGRQTVLPLEFILAEPPSDIAFHPDCQDIEVQLPALSVDARQQLWRRLVPVSLGWSEADRVALAERHILQVGEIAQIGRQDATTLDAVETLCRQAHRGRLGELGSLVDCPFERADLHVPPELARLLDEFLFEARDRARFWENPQARRLFPRGTGLTALMAGPPGTGKTMAAQVIAAELRLDLFRIDLAATVDKYIGETAKNLRRVFARAADMNAVLFFDEADALFSKRTDVKDSHDRYANADTNYLLQLVEDYPGIALLATNKRQNMDEAFVRRLRYLFYFPRPGTAERASIWRQMVTALAGTERARKIEPALDALASLVEASGAEIKSAVLAGVFMARQDREPLDVCHLFRGIERELRNRGRDVPVRLDQLERVLQ